MGSPLNSSDAAEKTPRLRRVLLGFVAASMTLGLCLVGAEILVRMTFGTPWAERLPISIVEGHATRGWRMLPGQDHFTYTEAVMVNSLGFRGPEVPAERGSEFRILALGDSLTYGQGVGDDETLPYYLEQQLETLLPDSGSVRVINTGHRAYATNQELALYRELGTELQPDLVVIFWYWNDVGDCDVETNFNNLTTSGPRVFDTNAPATDKQAERKWQLGQIPRRSAFLMFLNDSMRAHKAVFMTREQQQTGLDSLRGYLNEFSALAKERGQRLAFCAIPDAGTIGREHPSDWMTDQAVAVATECGIPATQLDEHLEQYFQAAGEVPKIPFDGHYLPLGNRILAETAAEFLRDEGLVTN